MLDYKKTTKRALYEMVQQHEVQTENNRKQIDAVNARLAQNQQLINRAENAELLATRLRIECEVAKNQYAALLERIGTVGLRIIENGPVNVETNQSEGSGQ